LLVEVLAVSFFGRRGADFIVMVVDVGETGETGEYGRILKIVMIAMMAEDIIFIGRLPISRSAV
jgi:hypothetical protein